ncbi:MAG: hypothetical protein AAF701_05120 [Pseudomonadota bacterium]
MGKVIKTILYVLVFACIALVGFAYIGPLMGVDFSAPSHPIRLEVDLIGD